MRRSGRLAQAAISCLFTASYGVLACLLTWPLPRHLRTHLLGNPDGDLGVYIWNLWIFRHELLRHATLPLGTDHLFGEGQAADLSLHNYTPLAGALGVPLMGTLGIVATFNVLTILFIALSGGGMFVLARRLGLGRGAAWCAGALFMASPVLTAKQTAHFSLVIAFALPLFLWALLRALELARPRDAVLVGVFVAVAVYSDAYYGIYCLLMGTFVVAWKLGRVDWPGHPTTRPWLARSLNALIALLAAAIAWRMVMGPGVILVGPARISLHSFYTPVLLLTAAVAGRSWLVRQPIVRLGTDATDVLALWRLGLVAIAACAILLVPLLAAIALRLADDQLPGTETFWRSSPRGLDVLSFVVPNPSHSVFGEHTRQWFMPPEPDAFPDMVGSLSLVSLALAATGAWLRVLPRMWVAFTGFFAWLSLGPFLYVAGVNTYIVGPWAFLRYVPIVELARTPSRFAVVATLGVSLLAAFAIARLPWRRAPSWGAAVVAVLAALELMSAPRHMYSAEVPDVYRLISVAAPGDEQERLLELPTGIRDGTSSLGNFSASSEYFQTSHRRPLVGGYLSRVSGRRKGEGRRARMFSALMTLSEGGTLTPAQEEDARSARESFLRRTCVRFVIVNKRRASEALQRFAVDVLQLMLLHEDLDYALYTPSDPPACAPRRPRAWRDGLLRASPVGE